MNNKYNNSIIYIIKCKDETIKDCYIGSTINFKRRKYHHKSRCYNENSKSFNLKVYKFIRDNNGWDNFYFDILENVNCNTRKELCKLEGEYIKLYKPSLNTNIEGRTIKEYQKEYRKNNKDKIKKYNKEYRELNKEYQKEYYEKNKDKIKEYYNDNKDKIREKNKDKIMCECGSIVRKSDIARHEKTIKCINILSKKE